MQLVCTGALTDISCSGGCYNISVAGSGVCREVRDGACVRYKEEHTVNGGRHGTSVGVRAASQCTQQANIDNCAENMCEMVGTTEVCTQCKTGGNVPIDGVCTAKDSATDKCKKADGSPVDTNDKVCGQCGAGYLLHKGGCYKKGQRPGQTICTDTSSTSGPCKSCASGYFNNPAATDSNDKESCIACGDVTGADNYKGRDKCATCDSSKLPASGGGTITCTTCIDGYFADNSGATCTQCTDPCATCTGSGDTKCTSCKDTNQYFKKSESDDGTGTCVAENACTNTHFPTTTTDSKKICTLCSDAANGGIADCKTCSKTDTTVTCSACTTEGKKPNTTGTACVACTIADCANCDKENVCAACTSSKKLSPLKDACLDSCPAGTYDSSNVCTPCHTSCSSCSDAGESSCTACYPGRVLSKSDGSTAGTCIPECTGRYAENCEASMCTAVLGGSKYCSKCAAGYAPIDGVCTKVATTRRDTSVCTASDGKCTACTGNYALLSSGCYNTKALPGSAVCTAATSGSCTTCANGQQYTNNNCPACAEGCSACSNGNTQQCTKCFAGYYLSNSKCFKCTADSNEGSNAITGVPNCVSCAPPTTSGTVTCYVTQTPAVDPTDPSVNKTGLSSGAIAGISVVVIAVVGGLVGFLCWWFICRGKA
ncbi:Variant-specific surface protein [Giardia duodenalis]|uniref:Variant-specific surface protein n=1 Tax=Giardia intestinalis TaxID=5741 RepID=V6TP90_GIAIN|nr:Variant-specific surface protein [Giardia intestinalis]